MLLSIIVSVYNVESYLETCIDSILECCLDDCEIILATGDSFDHSNVICERYVQHNLNIYMIAQSGKGLSNARNEAMQVAHGTYLLFVDSDDLVDCTQLNQMITYLRHVQHPLDVIVTDFRRLDRKTNQMAEFFQIGQHISVQQGMDFLPQMLTKRQCFWNVWRYIYRRRFLEDSHICFWENHLSEDVDFTTNVFLANPQIEFHHCPYYIYCVGRGDSLMDRPTLRRLKDTVEVLKNTIFRLRKSSFVHAHIMAAQFQFEYLLNMALTVEIDKANCAAARQLYRDWRHVLWGSSDPIVRAAALVIKIIGIRPVSYLLHILKLMRRWIRRNIRNRGQPT